MFVFKNRRLISLSLIIGVILLICLFSIPVLRKPAVDILKSPLKIFWKIGSEFRAIIFFHRHYIENKKLTKEIDSLRQKLIQAQELYLENIRLQKLLHFKKKSPYQLVAVRVIARDPSHWTSVVIIDKGRRDNIRKNLAVITYAGLLGKVVEAGNSTSKVMLLNDPNFSVSATVQRSRQEGLVSGTLDNRLIMRYLPRDADLKLGDIIITSGLTEVFPKGIAIGTVAEIRKEFSGLSIYCLIAPKADLANLEETLVIIK